MSVWDQCRVLVTGGLGFIGSNLAVRLVRAGARVTVIDSSVPGCGANSHNLAEACGRLRTAHCDIADAKSCAPLVRESNIIFNLAGEISHVHSMRWPERDSYLNAAAQLRFVELCGRENPGVRVVYASTRQIYGVPRYLPVDEQHPVIPVDFNGIHKYAAMKYHLLWSEMGKIDARILCLTNVYGPRMAIRSACQGFLGHFLRLALTGERIEVFGDGRQLRDPLFVDDAVDAFLLAGSALDAKRRVWNVGGGRPLPLAEIARMMSEAGGCPPPLFRPFPEDRKRIDIGSYATDGTRFREDFGWSPGVAMECGIRRSLAFFREHQPYYLQPHEYSPACGLDSNGGLYRLAAAQ